MTEFEQALADIEGWHKDAGSLAATVEHHWPTIKAEITRLRVRVAELAASIEVTPCPGCNDQGGGYARGCGTCGRELPKQSSDNRNSTPPGQAGLRCIKGRWIWDSWHPQRRSGKDMSNGPA